MDLPVLATPEAAPLAHPEAAPLAHPDTPRKTNVEADSNANESPNQDANSVETEEMEASAPPAAVRKLFPAPAVKTRRPSKTARAGLVLSVPRVLERLRRGRYALKVKETAAVYVAATLEYLVAEVLELAGNCARYFKKKRVAPRHILLTLRHDKELEELTKGAIVPEGGVRPFVHPQLLPKGVGGEEGAPEERVPTGAMQSQIL